jgi:hypothetical protein
MTDDEIAKTYCRAEELHVQITTMAKEMFGHLAALGAPPTLVLQRRDGEHTMHNLARHGKRPRVNSLRSQPNFACARNRWHT